MPRRLLPLLVTLLVVVVGCSPAEDSSTTTSDATVTTTTGDSVPAPDQRLAVATVGGAILVLDELGSERSLIEPAQGSAYRQPAWLADGSLVASFASVDEGTGLVAFDPSDGAQRWLASMSSPPFYYLPSPGGIETSTTSLRNDPGGDGLIAELVSRDGEVEELARVAPFYASWSPDGRSLAIHGQGARIDVRTEAGTATIAEPSGEFQAPVWTPDGLIVIRTTDIGQVLSVWDGASFRDVARVGGAARFTASHGKMAIQAFDDDAGDGLQASQRLQTLPEVPNGRLSIIDLASGEISSITDVLTPLFQWDPTGKRLLFASFTSDDSLDFTWSIWEGGTVTEGPAWQAQPIWFRDLAPFFDQFVQSISLWSTDGSAYAYPEVVDARPVVTIQHLDGTPPVRIDDATWVSWRTSNR